MEVCKTCLKLLSSPTQQNGVLIFDTYDPSTGLFAEDNIQVYLAPKWGRILDKPTFSPVAFTGDYNDLSNKPSMIGEPLEFIQWDNILNKPDLNNYTLDSEFTNFANSINNFAKFPNKVEFGDFGYSLLLDGKIRPDLLPNMNINDQTIIDHIDEFAETLGVLAFQDTISLSNLDSTLIVGGKFRPELLDITIDASNIGPIIDDYIQGLHSRVGVLEIKMDLIDGEINDIHQDINDTNNNITTQISVVNGVLATKVSQTTFNDFVDGVNNDINEIEGTLTTHTTQINQNATQIGLKATQTSVDNLNSRVTNAESQLIIQAGQIASKVSQTTFTNTVNNISDRIQTAETNIIQNANSLSLKASQTEVNNLKGRMTNAESQINIQADQITSKVSQTDFNTLDDRLINAESEIIQNANSITQKVSTTDYNGNTIATKINQTATTILLNASKINLVGAVSFNSFNTPLKDDFTNLQDSVNELASVRNYVENVLPGELTDINAALDGLMEQHFFTSDPSNLTLPTSDWIANSTENDHLGDLYYNTSSGQSWRYVVESGIFLWKEIVNSDLTAALAAASAAQITADGKRRVFVATPFPPYDIGDLWVQGSTGDIKVAAVNKASGVFDGADWVKASKYTDDTALINFVDNTYSEDQLLLQSQLDGKIQTFNQTNDPSIDWTTPEDKTLHTGDIWYNPTLKVTKLWNGTAWTNVNSAQAELAQTLAQAKKRIFTTTPVPPYDMGDLWVQGSTGDIKFASIAKTSGQTFDSADWVVASKYTDDTATNILISELAGKLAYEEFVEVARLGNTIIDGGYIKTELVNTNALLVRDENDATIGTLIVGDKINTGLINAQQIIVDGGGITQTDLDNLQINNLNLLLNSGTEVTNSNHNIQNYPITNVVASGEEVTLTIWGELGSDRTEWSVYNSGASVLITTLDNTDEISPGLYRKTFDWVIGAANNTNLWVYQSPDTGTESSTITKIKLERGNRGSDYTPNPEDKIELSKLGSTVVIGGLIRNDAIDTKGLQIKDAAGNVVFSATAGLDGTYIQNLSADKITIGNISIDRMVQNVIGAVNNNTVDKISANRIETTGLIIGQNIGTGYIDTKVNEISIGSVNILRNSNFKLLPVGWTSNIGATYSYNPSYITITTSGVGSGFFRQPEYNNFIAGEQYSWSFEFYPVTTTGANFRIGVEGVTTTQTLHTTPEWKKYTFSGNLTSQANFTIYNYNSGSNTFRIRNLMMVKGNKISTTWSPNPKDVSEEVTLVAGETAQDILDDMQLGGQNLLINSSFEDASNIAGIVPYNSTGTVTLDTTNFYDGRNSVKFVVSSVTPTTGLYTSPDLSNILHKIMGKKVVYSIMVKGQGSSIGKTARTHINDGVASVSGTPVTLTNQWQQISQVYNVPITANTFRLFLFTDAAIGETIFIDCAQLQLGNTSTPWAASPDDLRIALEKMSYYRNLLRVSNTRMNRPSGSTNASIGVYYTNKTLVVGQAYTLVVKGSNTGGAIKVNIGGQILTNPIINSEDNVTKYVNFTATNAATSIIFIKDPSSNTGAASIEWAGLYEGSLQNPPLEWIASPEDLKYEIEKYTYDNVITAQEKKGLKIKFEDIKAQYTAVNQTAAFYPSSGLSTTAYNQAYSDLYAILNPLLTPENINKDSAAINRAALDSAIENYSIQYESIREDIDYVVKNKLSDIEDALTNVSTDDRITAIEKRNIVPLLENIKAEALKLQNSAAKYPTNTTVTSALSTYNATYTKIDAILTFLTSNLNVATDFPFVVNSISYTRELYNTTVHDYFNNRRALEVAIENALQTKTSGGRVFYSFNSTYQVGDLWFPKDFQNIDSKDFYPGKGYRAISVTPGRADLDWVEISYADSATVNSKARVYSTIPSSYNAGDLVILNNDFVGCGFTFSKGIWVAKVTSTVCSSTHWEKVQSYASIDTVSKIYSTASSAESGKYKKGDYLIPTNDENYGGGIYYAGQAYIAISNINGLVFNPSHWIKVINPQDLVGLQNAIDAANSKPRGWYPPCGSTPTNYKVDDTWVPLCTDTFQGVTFYKGLFYRSTVNRASGFNAGDWIQITDPAGQDTSTSYLKLALEGSTEVNGGLILTNFIGAKTSGPSGQVVSYMNGLIEKPIAFAAGVVNFDALTGAGETQKVKFNHDGSGHLASGKIVFDTAGNLSIESGVTIKNGVKVGGWNIENNNLVPEAGSPLSKWGYSKITNYGEFNFYFNHLPTAPSGAELKRTQTYLDFTEFGGLKISDNRRSGQAVNGKKVISLSAMAPYWDGNSFLEWGHDPLGIALHVQGGDIYFDNIIVRDSTNIGAHYTHLSRNASNYAKDVHTMGGRIRYQPVKDLNNNTVYALVIDPAGPLNSGDYNPIVV